MSGEGHRIHPVHYTLKCGDRVIEQTAYRHDFMTKDGHHIWQHYGRVVDLLDASEVSHGFVLSAEAWLMDARAVWKKGHEQLLRDPLYFVEYPKEG